MGSQLEIRDVLGRVVGDVGWCQVLVLRRGVGLRGRGNVQIVARCPARHQLHRLGERFDRVAVGLEDAWGASARGCLRGRCGGWLGYSLGMSLMRRVEVVVVRYGGPVAVVAQADYIESRWRTAVILGDIVVDNLGWEKGYFGRTAWILQGTGGDQFVAFCLDHEDHILLVQPWRLVHEPESIHQESAHYHIEVLY